MPDAKVKIALELNGDAVEVAFAPHKTLLEVLREDLGLTGTKHGCELGECGTCTVLLDATPVLSCLVLGLACAGRRVKTVEGMAAAGTLHPLQEAFADRKSTRLNSSHLVISYAVFCLQKKTIRRCPSAAGWRAQVPSGPELRISDRTWRRLPQRGPRPGGVDRSLFSAFFLVGSAKDVF